jgi:hypothetical protein
MLPWKLKALIQGLIALLPGSARLNILARNTFLYLTGKTPRLTIDTFETLLKESARHLDNYYAQSPAPRPHPTVVELGTGKHPVVPVGLFLCGAGQIWTIDKVPLLQDKVVREVLQTFVDQADTLPDLLPQLQPDRLARIEAVLKDDRLVKSADLLRALDIDVLVRDARESGLDAGTIDLFISNMTLEHIPPDVILGLFTAFRGLATPGAVMSHYIDMTDHYTYYDSSVTAFNFLRYTEAQWRWFNNSLHYQSRLRLSDYESLHTQAGFEVVASEHKLGNPEHLDAVPLADQFKSDSRKSLLIRYSWMVSICDPR